MELPPLDAVAELIKRESAVRKTAVYSLNSGACKSYVSCIRDGLGIRQQHRFGGVFRAYRAFMVIVTQ